MFFAGCLPVALAGASGRSGDALISELENRIGQHGYGIGRRFSILQLSALKGEH